MSSLLKIPPSLGDNRKTVCERLHAHLKTDIRYDPKFLPPPLFFEYTGSPSSGKSTVIKKIDDFLRGEGFRVFMPQEGAEVIRHVSRSTPLYNIRTGIHALAQLIDIAQGHQYDVVIFDRCIFDVDNWMAYWEDKNLLTPNDRIMIQEFFRFYLWANEITAAYILTCEPEVALKRERRVTTRKNEGTYTNHATIAQLVGRYKLMHERLSPTFSQLELIDTTPYSAQQLVDLMTEKLSMR
jgi:thymidylate kinase